MYLEISDNHLTKEEDEGESEKGSSEKSHEGNEDEEEDNMGGGLSGYKISEKIEEDMEHDDYNQQMFTKLKVDIQQRWRHNRNKEAQKQDGDDPKKKQDESHHHNGDGSPLDEEKEELSHEHGHDDHDEHNSEDSICSHHKNYFNVNEDQFVEKILDMFLIGTESSFLNSINISLMLQALPNKIVDINLQDMLKFNFNIL